MLNPNAHPAPPSSPILGVGDHRTDVDAALNPAKPPQIPSTPQLWYDSIMMVLIVVDLVLMGLDSLMMSNFALDVSGWLGISERVTSYQSLWHSPLKTLGGFFTIFLVVELLVRWGLAIVTKRYYRWFFFPFVHWYEVLGCAPQLRALRLLRVGVIGYRLYQIGKLHLPKSWITTGKFYYSVVLEEISDRVIITALDNIRMELANADSHLVQSVINKHRGQIQAVVVDLLDKAVTPILTSTPANSVNGTPVYATALANQVGTAIQQSLTETHELRRIIRMIPIAGGLIEQQMLSIGQHIGENLVISLTKNLTQRDTLAPIYSQIGTSIATIDTTNPVLEKLVRDILYDSLDAFEKQVRVQQWKHKGGANVSL